MKSLSENKTDRFHSVFFTSLLSHPCSPPASFATAFPTQVLPCISTKQRSWQWPVQVVEGQCCGDTWAVHRRRDDWCVEDSFCVLMQRRNSPPIIKVIDIWLRIKTQSKRKCVPGRSKQKNIYSKAGRNESNELKPAGRVKDFNMAKEKSTATNKEEDRILWAIFLSPPVLRTYRIYLRGICI